MIVWLRKQGGGSPFEGLRVLITGGSSGIGLRCAQDLARAGARVILLARGEEALQKAASTMDPRAPVIAADVTDQQTLAAAVDAAASLSADSTPSWRTPARPRNQPLDRPLPAKESKACQRRARDLAKDAEKHSAQPGAPGLCVSLRRHRAAIPGSRPNNELGFSL